MQKDCTFAVSMISDKYLRIIKPANDKYGQLRYNSDGIYYHEIDLYNY